MAQSRTHIDLEADLGGNRVPGKAENRRTRAPLVVTADSSHTKDVTGPCSNRIEANRTKCRQDLADRIATSVRNTARRQDQIGTNQLIFNSFTKNRTLIRNSRHAEGLRTSICNSRRKRVAIGIEDRSGARLTARFNDLITDGQNHHAGTRVNQNAGTANAGKQSNLTGTHTGPRSKNNGSFFHVLSLTANVLPHRRLSLRGDFGNAMVAEFQSKNCIRTLRHRSARRDADRAASDQGSRVNITRADFFRNGQNDRGIRASTFKVSCSNRVAIARSQISNRKVEGSLNVLCQDAAHGVWKLNIQRGLLPDGRNTVLIEISDRAHYRPRTFARRPFS